MKKLFALLLVLSLFLTGCGTKEASVSHSIEDLTIRIPAGYIDLTGEDFAADLAFVFGRDPIAVNGLREEKSTFEAYGLNLDLQSYGKFVILANNVSATIEEKDGIYTFSYESNGFTYVVTVWETETAFWTVQAYCPNENYGKAKNEMWSILRSVKV